MKIILILPLPPSVNVRKTLNRRFGTLIDSTVYRKYMKEARDDVFTQAKMNKWEMIKPTFEQQLVVWITVFFQKKNRDATNCLKPILDVMSKIIYTDDKWILARFKNTEIDAKNPHVEVEI